MQARRHTDSHHRPLFRPVQSQFFDQTEALSKMFTPDLILMALMFPS